MSRSKRTTHDLRSPHLRALRKELLIVRADVERIEFAQATRDLREAVTHFSWLKFIIPGFASTAGRWRGRRGGAAGTLGALLKEYPLISSIVSMVLAKPLRQTVAAGAKPALKWGSVVLGLWEGWRIWQQIKADRSEAGPGGK